MIVLMMAISAPVAMMLLHVALQRLVYSDGEPKARLKLVIRIVMGVTIAWGLLGIGVFRSLPLSLLFLNTLYVMVVSFGLGMCYFNVFALGETALRIRFLMESYIADRRGETRRDFGASSQYDPETMVGVRIERLLALGAACEQAGKIVMTNVPLVLTAKLFYNARSLWRGVLFGPEARPPRGEDDAR
jgi:hypothetical protein